MSTIINQKEKNINSFLLAFHAGPRVCLGQNLATLEALTAIIFLVKRYKFRLMAGQEITYQVSLTLPMRYGMKVMVEKRQ